METKMEELYQQMSETLRRVADYLRENTDDVFRLPIAELARRTGVSPVSWVRFCKLLGYRGLKEMKKSYFEELNSTVQIQRTDRYEYTDIKDYTSVESMAAAVKNSSLSAIRTTVESLDVTAVDRLAADIIWAASVGVFGVGASGLVAADLCFKLLRIGKSVFSSRDTHVQLTGASTLTQRDVAIFISNSGRTDEILEMLQLAKGRGAVTAAITKDPASPLAKAARYRLITSSPELDRRSGAMSSRIAQLVLVDILFTAVANRDYAHVEDNLERSYSSCMKHRVSPQE